MSNLRLYSTRAQTQGVERVLYSYKILYFQTCPIKSYKLSRCPIFSYVISLLPQNFQEKFKKLISFAFAAKLRRKKFSCQKDAFVALGAPWNSGLEAIDQFVKFLESDPKRILQVRTSCNQVNQILVQLNLLLLQLLFLRFLF